MIRDSSPPAGGGRAGKECMFSVYVLYNKKHNKIYIGQTGNIIERKESHDKKIFKNSYTARFDGDWSIIYTEPAESRKQALIREKQLKSYRGREFVKKYIPR